MAMSESAILWLLGILVGALTVMVGIVTALVATVYKDIKESLKSGTDALQQAKNDALNQHKEMWDVINKTTDKFHAIENTHVRLCQKHEDEMADQAKRLAEHEADIYKWRHLLTETTAKMENKIRGAENSIRVLAEIANELKNGK
jgi:hypothetical protein